MGWAISEIAEELEIEPSTVRVLVYRARRKLRDEDPGDEEEPGV